MSHQKVLIHGDTHFPFHDQKILDLIYLFAEWWKPDIIIHGGDLMDCYRLSKFSKDPSPPDMLDREFEAARNHLKILLLLAKEVHFIEGNHEARLNKYLNDCAPELKSLTQAATGEVLLTVENILGLNEMGIEFIKMAGREAYKKYNEILVGHFNKVSKHSAYTAKALVEDKGMSIIQGHCFSEDTEVLTINGWKTFDNLSKGEFVLTYNLDTGASQWQLTKDVFCYSHYKELVHFHSTAADLLVTPEHAVVGSWRYKKAKFERTEAKKWVGKRVDMPNGGQNTLSDYGISDEELKMIAWIITEGHYPKDSMGIRISQSDKEKVDTVHITDICDTLGLVYSKKLRYKAGSTTHGQYRNYDAYNIHLFSSEFTRKIRCTYPTKKLGRWLLSLSKRQFDLFLHEIILGDGCYNKSATRSAQYSTKHKEEVDVLQSACCFNGYRATINKRTHSRGTIYYTITINTRGVSSLSRSGYVPYDGKVYCASVDNGTLVVRRNGKAIVSGNTHRGGVYYKTIINGQLVGIENFCTCDVHPSYIQNPNWQQGFTCLLLDRNGKRFSAFPICIVDYKFLFGDKKFSL